MMKKMLTFILFLCCLSIQANDISTWLSRVDKSLEKRESYEQARLDKIEKLNKKLKTDSPTEKFKTLNLLFEEYKSYRYDSASVLANRELALAKALNNEEFIALSKCDIAFCLSSSGLFKEAIDIIKDINIDNSSERIKILYYDISQKIWQEIANFTQTEPYYTEYTNKSKAYIDSIKSHLTTSDAKWWEMTGAQQMKNMQFEAAIGSFNTYLNNYPKADTHEKAMVAAELAWAYLHKDDKEQAIINFARSAIFDNESATREITALFFLAKLINERGDYERANRYAQQALEDITFYNARQRKIEIGEILPIIAKNRYNNVRNQRNQMLILTILSILALIALLASACYSRKQNKKLREARQTIEAHNQQLKVANQQLKEANKIKNEYIGRSFYVNAEYITKLEKLFSTVNRKIAARQYEDLRTTTSQNTLNEERKNMYVAFDETFLKLFPNFVEQYNLLFDESDRKKPSRENALTSEMRIFALIRLGITDSERIARFLDYSVHTVNTYKTRIKNRSIVDNDLFEQKIMEI